MSTSLTHVKASRQSLGYLLEEHQAASVELATRDAHGWPHGNLDAYLDSLAAQIAEHPEYAWDNLECVEEARLR